MCFMYSLLFLCSLWLIHLVRLSFWFIMSSIRLIFLEYRNIAVSAMWTFHGRDVFGTGICFMTWVNESAAFLRVLQSSWKGCMISDSVLHIMQVGLIARWCDQCLFDCKVRVPVKRWHIKLTYLMAILLHQVSFCEYYRHTVDQHSHS